MIVQLSRALALQFLTEAVTRIGLTAYEKPASIVWHFRQGSLVLGITRLRHHESEPIS